MSSTYDFPMSEQPQFRAMPFPPGAERIVSMVTFKDRLLVATDEGVYELVDGAWSRMALVEAITVPNGIREGK
jgi:hypothetical protein